MLLLLLSAGDLSAQNLYATIAGPGRVVLTWPPDSTQPLRYNIYRKLAAAASYPTTPINTAPLGPVTDCPTFKTQIPQGSDLWNLLSNAFTDTTTNAPLANVCTITGFPVGSDKWWRVQLFARARLQVARVMGQGYVDNTVTTGTAYRYQIRRVASDGSEMPLIGTNEVAITAGTAPTIPTAANVHRVVGDAKIQILWNKPSPQFALFNVYRALNAGGPYRRVNEVDMSFDITRDLDSNAVSPVAHGFTDYERWDSSGNVDPRSVTGVPGTFTGPANGTTYWYRIALKDIGLNEGPQSAPISGTPVDRTPPASPQNLIVTPLENESHFEIKWPKVHYDADGHKSEPKHYKVYRYATGDNPNVGAIPLTGTVLHTTDSSVFVAKIDSSSGMRSPCRDTTLFFRVEAVDSAGNISPRSAAVSGSLKDTTKPKPPQGTTAEGFDDYIKVRWKLNTDCDIAYYLIYRSLCDYGEWVPCPEITAVPVGVSTSSSIPSGVPTTSVPPPNPNTPNDGRGKDDKKKKPKDCGGPFVLIGVLSHDEAKARASGGITYFDDHTVPDGSPICYAYLVKAQDLAQNISGNWPIPDLTKETVVCQRLRDRTPPEPAIISGMVARDSAIRVEFIGPPVQDIAAYHIYRAEMKDGPYKWVGGMTVVPPPGVGAMLSDPYKPPPVVGCDSIPLVSNEYMSAGRFVDKKIEPKKIYWYKALGVDKDGNETPVDSALAVSTFTFKSNRENAPTISGIAPTEGPCALTVSWGPSYDATTMKGFVVFRSRHPDGPYLQLENVVTNNTFADNSVARNVIYWYRVGILKADGAVTNLSEPQNGVHP
jgi:hypothetical protein